MDIYCIGVFIAEIIACLHHKFVKSIYLFIMINAGNEPGQLLHNEAAFFVLILEETFELIGTILLCNTVKQIPEAFASGKKGITTTYSVN